MQKDVTFRLLATESARSLEVVASEDWPDDEHLRQAISNPHIQ
jgi:hypothetical protein